MGFIAQIPYNAQKCTILIYLKTWTLSVIVKLSLHLDWSSELRDN